MKIIQFNRSLDIRNVESLPRGLGAPMLECIEAQHNQHILIARRWRRQLPKKPESDAVFLWFGDPDQKPLDPTMDVEEGPDGMPFA